ncbi:hypothetical protein THASP1DRAFT_25644 [Thamnocephalis sphaerospora]|uniref:Uncharacterized protein n=1 Tax=Thamnocephalis sphaerospora TaxID=78915 RepID=A0A4P9XJK6_9FUNG|nr:hypothetical protein THASP1DRAFT_25644 [Thamnocephalis sphaerospora]|eukprot:RKP05947.1 hypothetical protein THASP1DRAFT_25644 [Thamnocephalis sphaerospora]
MQKWWTLGVSADAAKRPQVGGMGSIGQWYSHHSGGVNRKRKGRRANGAISQIKSERTSGGKRTNGWINDGQNVHAGASAADWREQIHDSAVKPCRVHVRSAVLASNVAGTAGVQASKVAVERSLKGKTAAACHWRSCRCHQTTVPMLFCQSAYPTEQRKTTRQRPVPGASAVDGSVRVGKQHEYKRSVSTSVACQTPSAYSHAHLLREAHKSSRSTLTAVSGRSVGAQRPTRACKQRRPFVAYGWHIDARGSCVAVDQRMLGISQAAATTATTEPTCSTAAIYGARACVCARACVRTDIPLRRRQVRKRALSEAAAATCTHGSGGGRAAAQKTCVAHTVARRRAQQERYGKQANRRNRAGGVPRRRPSAHGHIRILAHAVNGSAMEHAWNNARRKGHHTPRQTLATGSTMLSVAGKRRARIYAPRLKDRVEMRTRQTE